MNPTSERQSYAEENIYIGIDVHKKTYALVARVGRQEVKCWTTTADPKKVAHQLKKFFEGGNIHTVYEAGFSGFVLHRELIGQGIQNIVVHAASVEIAVHDRVKTDKRDARKLAEHLEAGRLKGIRIPSTAQEQKRLLSRTRSQLVEQRSRSKNCIRMKAHQFGLIAPDEKREMSHSFVEELLQQCPCEEFRWTVTAHWVIWKTLDQEIAQLEKKLREQAKSDAHEATYRSAPGVGALSARILSNELGDLSQFHNERQLFSYTGLTPAEYSSGEKVRRGSITKQGNRFLRAILIEVAWRAIRKDSSLAQYFQQLSVRAGKKRAIVAVARKLIGRIRAAFRHQVLYHVDSSNPAT